MTIWCERAETSQIVEARAVAGGEHQDVHPFAGIVLPDDPIGHERLEQWSIVGPTGLDRRTITAVVQHAARSGGEQARAKGGRVQAGYPQPEMEIAAEEPLASEAQRRAAGQRDVGHARQLGGDLDGAVAGADPTTRWPANGSGERYSCVCRIAPSKLAWPGKTGRWAVEKPPVAAITLRAEKVRPSAVVSMNRPPTRSTRSTRAWGTIGSAK